MRRVEVKARSWIFSVNQRERDYLVAVLEAYPVVPLNHHVLSRESSDRLSAEDRELLREALLEHRTVGKTKVRRWLKGGARFHPENDEWRFTLTKTDLNWMMQVLNDVRMGSWLRLGSPDDIHSPFELLQRDPAAFFHMEAAGMFQMQFLEAARGPDHNS